MPGIHPIALREHSMIEVRPFDSLGAAGFGWLQTRHHFSFGGYHDPDRMGWGSLCVWNDDTIAPNEGFSFHPHRDMEIITYVRAGAITHEDSLGNRGRTEAGDVQIMSAGSGICHSEYNLEKEATEIFQIWIAPSVLGGAPRWDTRPFPKGKRAGRLVALASGFSTDRDALPLRAPARVLGATLRAGESCEWRLGADRRAYLVPSTGSVVIDGQIVNARDGAAIRDVEVLSIKALKDTELVLVDVM
jgi:redox-sensitive bicupin YhaK (pirin superfamily)